MDSNEKLKSYSIDEYHTSFAENIQVLLNQLRKLIKEVAPDSEELISYNMPAFKQKGILVYYAAYKKHIGFYPTGSITSIFKDKLVSYKTSKGAIQFPINKPLPAELIQEIVRYRVQENEMKSALKNK